MSAHTGPPSSPIVGDRSSGSIGRFPTSRPTRAAFGRRGVAPGAVLYSECHSEGTDDHRHCRRPCTTFRTRARRAAVGHPQVLRRHRHDARRHQPGRRRAGLRRRRRRSSRKASARCAAGRTHYTSNYGTIELRRALATHLERLYGVDYDPDNEICITVGASEAVAAAMCGDHRPGRRGASSTSRRTSPICRRSCSTAARRCSCPPRPRPASRSCPSELEAAITPRTKVLFLGYPCNPTGAVLDERTLRDVADVAQRHDLIVVSDEIYDRLVYGGHRHVPIASLPGMRDRTITDRWLLEGLRHDRLARRLRVRAAGPARGHRQGPPVRDHVRAHRRPGRGARRAQERRAGCRAHGRTSTTAAARCSSTA